MSELETKLVYAIKSYADKGNLVDSYEEFEERKKQVTM